MATTDTKPGFRLPWSSDRSEPTPPTSDAPESVATTSPESAQEAETPPMIDAVPAAPDHVAAVEGAPQPSVAGAPVHETAVPASAPSAARKPNKFMADLTKAMQAAAEAAREDTLGKVNAEAKTFIEGIHTESAAEATELRKRADDDVAGIRDWSKAEIARIREETDERIAHRKRTLESEIEEHAAAIEARIERVQARVTAFENEMAAFFERLLAEDDPTRFAAMAESLPEPPPFDGPMPDRAPTWTPAPAATPVQVAQAAETADADLSAPDHAEAVVMTPDVADETEAPTDVAPATPGWETAPTAPVASSSDPDPAWGSPDPGWGAPEATEDTAPAATAVDHGDLFGAAVDDPADTSDPRVAALGLTPDFAAAEAEAAAYVPTDDGSDEEVAPISDDAIAARLAGLVPEDGAVETATTTRVIVTGLISVASIAGFKRHLSRAPGVQSVGVSSGPDGEFVFAVAHAAEANLGDLIVTLPGFGARVTATADGEITVAAHDPEAEG